MSSSEDTQDEFGKAIDRLVFSLGIPTEEDFNKLDELCKAVQQNGLVSFNSVLNGDVKHIS